MASRRSTKAKGALLERRATRLLEEQGYLIDRAHATPIYGPGGNVIGSNANDRFGVFDILASSATHMRLVQVTVVEKVSARRRKVEKVLDRVPIATGAVTAEVWGWVGGRRVEGKLAQAFRVWKAYSLGLNIAVSGRTMPQFTVDGPREFVWTEVDPIVLPKGFK